MEQGDLGENGAGTGVRTATLTESGPTKLFHALVGHQACCGETVKQKTVTPHA
jgi:hypothetical protein